MKRGCIKFIYNCLLTLGLLITWIIIPQTNDWRYIVCKFLASFILLVLYAHYILKIDETVSIRDDCSRMDNICLNLAKMTAMHGTCLRRNYGATILTNKSDIVTGYTSAPDLCKPCNERGICLRQEKGIPSGERYELCKSVHAEQNALIKANGADLEGATLYLVGIDAATNTILENAEPCLMCKKMILQSGIQRVITYDTKNKCTKIIDVKTYIADINSL